jgi:hypothetical protein
LKAHVESTVRGRKPLDRRWPYQTLISSLPHKYAAGRLKKI